MVFSFNMNNYEQCCNCEDCEVPNLKRPPTPPMKRWGFSHGNNFRKISMKSSKFWTEGDPQVVSDSTSCAMSRYSMMFYGLTHTKAAFTKNSCDRLRLETAVLALITIHNIFSGFPVCFPEPRNSETYHRPCGSMPNWTYLSIQPQLANNAKMREKCR